jgi:hypothetical protein
MIARAVIVLVVLAVTGGVWLTLRLIGTGRHKGQRRAPRWYTAEDERLADTLERVIPRPVTEHAPPWEDAPAAVIEPAAVTQGPPEPGPDAYWLAAGTYNRATGQAQTVRVELLPPVEALLGHATTTAAVESMSAQWHSVESIFNGHHVRQVRAITDGAP